MGYTCMTCLMGGVAASAAQAASRLNTSRPELQCVHLRLVREAAVRRQQVRAAGGRGHHRACKADECVKHSMQVR